MTRLTVMAQKQHFSRELYDLQKYGQVSAKSRLFTLSPFLDRKQIIRVGGRIKNAEIPFDQKHQIVLPKASHFTDLIAQSEHWRQLHCGALSLLSSLRQKYWPISGRDLTRKIVRRCIVCFKVKPRSIQQIMGNLPSSRVQQNRPFLYTGVDFCGPFLIRPNTGRGNTTIKAYVAIFICFATKAIHIELVSNMTSEAFIGALRRFIARRGLCRHLYSDNGTNFVGANNQLKEIQRLFQSEQHKRNLNTMLTTDQIEWHFIPPRTPNFGGLWEAGVKAIKHHLKRVAGTANLTYEELYTLLTQIEACINSRPITAISTDPNDDNILTPGHFLIGEPMTAVPDPDLTPQNINRLFRWKRVQHMYQQIWRRWSTEYLNQLQQKMKWAGSFPNIQRGTIVLLKDENQIPMKWPLGRVTDVILGDDGKARVVVVKTATGITKRGITRVCPLPMETNQIEY